MPIPEIQITSELVYEKQLQLLGEPLTITEPFSAAALTPATDGKIYLPPLIVRSLLSVFGSCYDQPPSDQNALDIGCKLNITVKLVQTSSRQYCALSSCSIDLSDHNSKSFIPSSPLCRMPYYTTLIKTGLITNRKIPEYGEYVLKTLVQRVGVDRDYHIQNMMPITISRKEPPLHNVQYQNASDNTPDFRIAE